MDFRLTEEQELLRRTVREFAEAEMRPHVMAWDEAQQFPMDLLPKLAELGLTGVQFPEEYGGAGMSAVDYCICIEELARVVSGDRAVGGGAQRPLLGAHRDVRQRGAEAAVPAAARCAARCSAPGGSPRRARAATPPGCGRPPCARATAG